MENYIKWLTSVLLFPGANDELIRIMLGQSWSSYISGDRGCEDDALAFRNKWEIDSKESIGQKPASFLEVVIGLSLVLELLENNSMSWINWFWILMNNLGLGGYGGVPLSANEETEIKKVMIRVIRRRYKADGNGGLFPVPETENKQQDVELLYQLQEWFKSINKEN